MVVWNQDAGTGSAILTTTRDTKVAQIMSGKFYNLGNLDDVFLKEIVERTAFILQTSENLVICRF
jgi:hypothetical protein